MKEPGLDDVPVVALAAQNDRDAHLRALKDGLDDVLTHPFKDTLLLARIRSLLRARAVTQDLQVSNEIATNWICGTSPDDYQTAENRAG